MNFKMTSALSLLIFSSVQAATFDGKVDDWKGKSQETFQDPETNFKYVLKTLRERYLDRDLSEADLYRAATAGMLAALNTDGEHADWNVLLSPAMLRDFMIEKTGKLTGIGATLEFDEKSGYTSVLVALPNSPALKAGMKKGDMILSVNGQPSKGKKLRDLVGSLRGPAGESVKVKVLRDDQTISLKVTRDKIVLPALSSRLLDASTGLLNINYFSEETSQLIEGRLRDFDGKNIKRLIVDLRGNGGGVFDDALKVAEVFLPENAVITRTRSRDGHVEEFKSHHSAWRPEVQIVVLTDHDTASSAELLTAALRDDRHATIVGVPTQGKWNVQTVETLPNKFAFKYSVMNFESPSGKSYQTIGIKPDVSIDGPKGIELHESQEEPDVQKRLLLDAPLKVALGLAV